MGGRVSALILQRYTRIANTVSKFMCTPKYMYRWLKQSGVHLSSEGKQHALCKELIGDNLESFFIKVA